MGKKLIGVRKIAHLAIVSDEELELENRRYGRRKAGGRSMSFPLWYTTSLRRAMRDRCKGVDAKIAALRIQRFPENLMPKGQQLLSDFEELFTSNSEVNLALQPAPKSFNAELGDVRIQPRQDLVGRCGDGRLFLGYLHVVDKPLSQAEADLLLSLASYVASAKGIEADVGILDVPRRKIIRQSKHFDRGELEGLVRRAKSRSDTD